MGTLFRRLPSAFYKFRDQPTTIIEIGIFNGGSLKMWKNYFGPKSTVVGVDINPECQKYAEPGIEIVIGDQGDRAFLRSLADRYPGFSILIDDGGHRMHQQIATFDELYLRMDPAGVYLCEDTHTSYWPTFDGGYKKPDSFIECIKPLIDRLHAFHSPDHTLLAPISSRRQLIQFTFTTPSSYLKKGRDDRRSALSTVKLLISAISARHCPADRSVAAKTTPLPVILTRNFRWPISTSSESSSMIITRCMTR